MLTRGRSCCVAVCALGTRWPSSLASPCEPQVFPAVSAAGTASHACLSQDSNSSVCVHALASGLDSMAREDLVLGQQSGGGSTAEKVCARSFLTQTPAPRTTAHYDPQPCRSTASPSTRCTAPWPPWGLMAASASGTKMPEQNSKLQSS